MTEIPYAPPQLVLKLERPRRSGLGPSTRSTLTEREKFGRDVEHWLYAGKRHIEVAYNSAT